MGGWSTIISSRRMSSASPAGLDLKKLTFFLKGALSCLPSHYANQEQNRLMLLYFVLGAQDLTQLLCPDADEAKSIIDWVYSQQLIPDRESPGR